MGQARPLPAVRKAQFKPRRSLCKMHGLKHENSDWGKQTDLEQAPLLLGALVS